MLFCRDVLRNDDFIKGYTPTGFIAQHYPDGFSGGQLSELERKQLVAIAREIARKRGIALGNPPMTLTGNCCSSKEDEVVVCLGGMFGDSYLVKSKIDLERDCSITSSVTKLQKTEDDDVDEVHVIELCNLDCEPSADLAQVSLAGEDRALQVRQNV